MLFLSLFNRLDTLKSGTLAVIMAGSSIRTTVETAKKVTAAVITISPLSI